MHNHFEKCWEESKCSLKYCNTSIPLAPCSMLNRNCHIFVLAIDIQTSNATLNGRRRRSNSSQVNCGKENVTGNRMSRLLLKVIVYVDINTRFLFPKSLAFGDRFPGRHVVNPEPKAPSATPGVSPGRGSLIPLRVSEVHSRCSW